MRFRSVVVALPLFLATASLAQRTVQVTHITDGDSLRVLHDGQELTIRLEGIDCPEMGQAGGIKAKQATGHHALAASRPRRITGVWCPTEPKDPRLDRGMCHCGAPSQVSITWSSRLPLLFRTPHQVFYASLDSLTDFLCRDDLLWRHNKIRV